MNTYLLTSPLLGLIWGILLFVLCFIFIHIARLVKFGWQYGKKNQDSQPQNEQSEKNDKEKTAPTQTQGPVYYIVERKKPRNNIR